MRKDSLPSPGRLSMGIRLQGEMSKAISAVELQAASGGGTSSIAKQLDNFLVAARNAIAAFIDAVVPTVSARIAGGYVGAIGTDGVQVHPNATLRVRANKWMDAMYNPGPAAFTLATPALVPTKVIVDGPDLVLVLPRQLTSAEGGTVTVAYAQPGAATNARDLSGNLLAAFAATVASQNAVV